MFKNTNAFYKSLFLLIALIAFSAFPIKSAFSQFTCLPTCDVTDAKFMALAGVGLVTTNNTDAFFQFISPPGNPTVEIGIFDGDGITSWDIDNPPFVILDFGLFADPNGDGTGMLQIAQWSSDGTFGDNIGDPMPDNDWFNRTMVNIPQAQTQDGTYSYRMRVININPGAMALNVFKVRTDGVLGIPAGEAFNYIASFRTLEDFAIIYPNVDFDDPACFDLARPGFFCDPLTDPTCCLIPSNYDGLWDFYFNVPAGLDTLDIWDGDFDFGSNSFDANDNCIDPDGVSVDTDDPNTPIPLPEWALGTDAITQGVSSPTNPADDFGCAPGFQYPPSVNYDLIDPNGMTYTNVNPSGNIEWELFNISTNPFNPILYDIEVSSIEPGLWHLHTFGNDLSNLNSFRLPFGVCALDENNEPVCPVEPDPRVIPTLNEWGLIALASMGLFISIYYIRRQRKVTTEIK